MFIDVTGTGYAPEGDFRVNNKPIQISEYPGAMSTLWLGVLNNDAELESIGEVSGEEAYRIVGDPTEGRVARGGPRKLEPIMWR